MYYCDVAIMAQSFGFMQNVYNLVQLVNKYLLELIGILEWHAEKPRTSNLNSALSQTTVHSAFLLPCRWTQVCMILQLSHLASLFPVATRKLGLQSEPHRNQVYNSAEVARLYAFSACNSPYVHYSSVLLQLSCSFSMIKIQFNIHRGKWKRCRRL